MIHYRRGNLEDLQFIYPSFAEEFPANERKTIEQLRILMEKGDYHLIVAQNVIHNNADRIGFAFVYMPSDSDFIWLDYLVIDKKHQSKGYGSLFFNYLLQTRKNINCMYIEVEIPNGKDVNQERRVNYYERLGAVKLKMSYQLPIPEGGVPMYLYLSKLENSESVAMAEVTDAIKRAHEYIHWDHDHLSNIYHEIIKSVQHE